MKRVDATERPWRGRCVLVTGAGGFIGANLVRRLVAEGARVHGVVRASGSYARLAGCTVPLHCVDLLECVRLVATLDSIRPEVVFDAAVIRPRDMAADAEGIARGNGIVARNLVAACAATEVKRLVALGSSLEYGPRARPLVESMACSPTTAFGRAKAEATAVVLDAAVRGDLPAVVLRLFSVYGPWEAPQRLLPRAIVAAWTRRPLPLTVPGIRRDFIHVDDVVDACLAAAGRPMLNGLAINVGTGVQTSNEDVVETVARALEQPIETLPGTYPCHTIDTSNWVADVGLAARSLGWRARIDLLQGIRDMSRWLHDAAQLVSYREAAGL